MSIVDDVYSGIPASDNRMEIEKEIERYREKGLSVIFFSWA
jgi:hypothetical protein